MTRRAVNQTSGLLLASHVEEARAFHRRLVGLMGRRGLPEGAGLHLDPCNGIHTFFMRFAIDALFLDREGRVVKTFAALAPWRVTSIDGRTRSVLELPAGVLASTGTKVGDRVTFEPLPPG